MRELQVMSNLGDRRNLSHSDWQEKRSLTSIAEILSKTVDSGRLPHMDGAHCNRD